MQPRIDPILATLLDKARESKDPVQVVVVLKPDAGESVSAPARTEQLASELIQRVQKETGEAPLRFNVFRNLSSVAVEATPNFIRSLIAKDEVASAIANQQPGSRMGSQLQPPVSKGLARGVASKATSQPATRAVKSSALSKPPRSIKKK